MFLLFKAILTGTFAVILGSARSDKLVSRILYLFSCELTILHYSECSITGKSFWSVFLFADPIPYPNDRPWIYVCLRFSDSQQLQLQHLCKFYCKLLWKYCIFAVHWTWYTITKWQRQCGLSNSSESLLDYCNPVHPHHPNSGLAKYPWFVKYFYIQPLSLMILLGKL